MKKGLLAILLLLTFSLSGCDTLFGTELEKAFVNLEKLDSYTVDIFIDGSIIEVDMDLAYQDGKAYVSFMEIEMYTFEEDGKYYKLEEEDGSYKAVEVDGETTEMEFTTDEVLGGYTAEDFEYNEEDSYYYYIGEETDEFDEFKFTIVEDNVKEVILTVGEGSAETSVTMTFSKLNDTVVELPEFTYMTELESAIYNLDRYGFSVDIFVTGFDCSSLLRTAWYDVSNDYISIGSGFDYVNYYPDTQEIEEDGYKVTLEYYISITSFGLDEEVYEYFYVLYEHVNSNITE